MTERRISQPGGAPPPDASSPTGSFAIVRDMVRAKRSKQAYGKRPHDRPLWWLFVFHGYKAIWQFLIAVALLMAAKKCGLSPADVISP